MMDSLCSLGTYSPSGVAECITCQAGFACPSTTSDNIITCAPGTFSLDMYTVSIVLKQYRKVECACAVIMLGNTDLLYSRVCLFA